MKLITLLGMTTADMTKIVNPIIEVCQVLVPVLLSVVGALGMIYCILPGVKFAKSSF